MEKGNDLKQLGSRISACRQNKNMTQEEMASRLGITPQALSKWERGISLPDVSMLASLSYLLSVSVDYLLGTESRENEKDQSEEYRFGESQLEIALRSTSAQEPLELRFSTSLAPCFMAPDSNIMDSRYVDKIADLRMQLAWEGLLLPIVRIADHSLLDEREFMVLAYGNVLYSEKLDVIDENTVDYMIRKLGESVRAKYYEIINTDIIRRYTDNWKIKYPALIEGIVPEKIPYSFLTEVARRVLAHGNSIAYLPKMIEVMDCALWEEPRMSIEALTERVRKTIEREDNMYVMLGKRREAGENAGKN